MERMQKLGKSVFKIYNGQSSIARMYKLLKINLKIINSPIDNGEKHITSHFTKMLFH